MERNAIAIRATDFNDKNDMVLKLDVLDKSKEVSTGRSPECDGKQKVSKTLAKNYETKL